jgi:hypothetical protein
MLMQRLLELTRRLTERVDTLLNIVAQGVEPPQAVLPPARIHDLALGEKGDPVKHLERV